MQYLTQSENIRVLVITGTGRSFSAGQDLKDHSTSLEHIALPSHGRLEKYYNPLITMINQSSKPVIAAVNGVAAGAGANIALACDIVVAKESASFLQAFSNIGLIPDAGGTWFLPRLVGRAKALGLFMLADRISAVEAEKLGMIWRVFVDSDFENEVEQLSLRLAQKPTYALSLIKQAIHQSATHSLAQQLELEKNLQYLASHSQDVRRTYRWLISIRKLK